MPFRWTIFVACVAMSAWCIALGQNVSAPYSLNVGLNQNVAKSGSGLTAKVTLTNTSNHEIIIFMEKGTTVGELDYDVEVRDDKGGLATKTKYHRAVKGEDTGETTITVVSPGPRHLQPGKSFEEEIVLNKLYDLTKPGQYTAQVERKDETTKIKVKSNKIAFTVIP
jgi:hypothetical protein